MGEQRLWSKHKGANSPTRHNGSVYVSNRVKIHEAKTDEYKEETNESRNWRCQHLCHNFSEPSKSLKIKQVWETQIKVAEVWLTTMW